MKLNLIFLSLFAFFSVIKVGCSSCELVAAVSEYFRSHPDSRPTQTLTYKCISDRFKMTPFKPELNSVPINPKVIVKLMSNSFRAMRLDMTFADNSNLLYNLMNDPEVLQILGYKHCIELLKDLVTRSIPYLYFDTEDNFLRSTSIVMELVDFFEFILKELSPRYVIPKSSPEYDFREECLIEYEGLVLAESIVNIRTVLELRDVEFLKVFVRRYAHVWPVSKTTAMMQDCLTLFESAELKDIYFFREILTFLIRSVPEYFVDRNMGKNYLKILTGPLNIPSSTCHLMFYMAPLFRALLMLDEEDVVYRYLNRYKQLTDSFSKLKIQRQYLWIFDVFISELRFSYVPATEVESAKKLRLNYILLKFFGIMDYYELAGYSLSESLLALYEVILQQYGQFFKPEQQFNLLRYIINQSIYTNNFELQVSITLGYLPKLLDEELFRDFELTYSEAESFSGSLGFIVEQRLVLLSCPLQSRTSILRDESMGEIVWPEPDFLTESDSDDPNLYYHAQAVLCRVFGIPVYGVSLFDNKLGVEGVTWMEMCAYLNLMIEKAAKFSGLDADIDFEDEGGNEERLFVKFKPEFL